MRRRAIALGAVAVLAAAAMVAGCGDDDDEEADATATDATTEESSGGGRALTAPAASITVDGDSSDWQDIEALEVDMEAIEGSDVPSKQGTVRVAHDDESVYVLFEVNDDYNWDQSDAHLSGSSAVMWNVEGPAGPHMGAEADAGTPSTGMVDLWHWELECAAGEESGGAANGPGDGDPGNDGTCNFDDEWATDAFTREDDNGPNAENSLSGVWTHSSPDADAEGTWIFEASRPLTTGDDQDAQLAVGETSQLALAYWDPDNAPEGWSAPDHAQTSHEGWIDVTIAE